MSTYRRKYRHLTRTVLLHDNGDDLALSLAHLPSGHTPPFEHDQPACVGGDDPSSRLAIFGAVSSPARWHATML
jgi:hypothetical protein